MNYYTQVLAALSQRGPVDQTLLDETVDTQTWDTTFDPRFSDERAAQSLATYLTRDLHACGATVAALSLVGANKLVLTYKAPRLMPVRTWQAWV